MMYSVLSADVYDVCWLTNRKSMSRRETFIVELDHLGWNPQLTLMWLLCLLLLSDLQLTTYTNTVCRSFYDSFLSPMHHGLRRNWRVSLLYSLLLLWGILIGIYYYLCTVYVTVYVSPSNRTRVPPGAVRSRCSKYKSSSLTLRCSWWFASASLSHFDFWTTQLFCLSSKTVELFAIVTLGSNTYTDIIL